MTKETFDEYYQNFTDEKLIRDMAARVQKDGLKLVVDMLVYGMNNISDLKCRYSLVRCSVYHLYRATDNACLRAILEAFYDLDVNCESIDIYQISPATDPDCTNDKRKEYFRQRYVHHRGVINGFDDDFDKLTLLEIFGRMIFKFNGYYAGWRSDPHQAIRDAYGLTDLFAETIETLD